MPRVSVIMSAYNEEMSISKAIESVLGQSYEDFELIVVDDGSKDDTKAIIRRYASLDRRVKLIENIENLGLTKSLIRGVQHAKGDLITRLDADDTYGEYKLESQTRYMDERPDVGWCIVKACDVTPDKELAARQPLDLGEMPLQTISNYLTTRGNLFYHGAVMFRKTLYDAVGGYRPFFNGAEDYDLWLRFHEVSPFLVINQVLYFRVTRPDGISLSSPIRQVVLARTALLAYESRQTNESDDEVLAHACSLLSRNDWKEISKFVGPESTWYIASVLCFGPRIMALKYLASALASGYSIKSLIKMTLLILPKGVRTRLLLSRSR